MALNDQEDLEALEHIVGVGVGAHAHGDAAAEELDTGAQPTALPILDSGLLTSQVPDSLTISISAGVTWMQWPSMVSGPSRLCCSSARRADTAAVEAGIPHIVHALAHVDVEAGQAVVGLGHLVHGLVRQRKGGVTAKHGGDHVVVVIATLLGGPLGKLGVLGNGLVAFFLATAVGDS